MKKAVTVKPKPDLKKPVVVYMKSFDEVLKLFPTTLTQPPPGARRTFSFV